MVMEILNLKPLIFQLAVAALSCFCLFSSISAQPGFISLDCGLPQGESYNDTKTGILYTSDSSFVETGKSMTLSPKFDTASLQKQLYYVRSFPQGIRNCYNLRVSGGSSRYLIRAVFMYGNYDGQSKVPQFEIHVEANLWDTVQLDDESTVASKEIIQLPSFDYLHVCLVNIGLGTPFISALGLRPLKNRTYTTISGSLSLLLRYDAGSVANQTVRYPDDIYDRIWEPYNNLSWGQIISRSDTVDLQSESEYEAPTVVMRTAATPRNRSETLYFSFETANPIFQFYIYMHFAEIETLEANQSREFEIHLNGRRSGVGSGAYSPTYLRSGTVLSLSIFKSGKNQFSINRTQRSTLPPLLNAIEVYTVNTLPHSQTNKTDVDAMMEIKALYGGRRNFWQGDPCAPQQYSWDGITCSYRATYDPPTIISLNLSSSGMTGEIPLSLSHLTSIQNLDLSYNSLTGSIPDFLSRLPSLRVLNLSGNNLRGPVPAQLLVRSDQRLLSLSLDGNPNLCASISCTKNKNNNSISPVVASVLSSAFIIITALAIVWILRRKRRKQVRRSANGIPRLKTMKSKTQQFTVWEIRRITNNFERIVGKGGFGTVYHGYFGETQVAVKMLSPSSAQGYKEFQAEVELLLTVHHRNLTALLGYCNEDGNLGLVYDYMANGNLRDYLSDSTEDTLSWEGRLCIALQSGQGLEYLHHGCKPAIVHRDVKTANILLNDKFQGKLSDFGLSRYFPTETGTHVSTVVAGTPGYLDPHYYVSSRLTEKSDVYSFGVVVLEIITGQPAILRKECLEDDIDEEAMHISEWTKLKLVEGDITNIVDKRLQGNFDVNSAWKALEIAIACVCPTSSGRPPMNHVVMELQHCLAIESVARNSTKGNDQNNNNVAKDHAIDHEIIALETEPSLPLPR